MKQKILALSLLGIILCSSISVSFASPLDVNVPPTRAFAKFFSNGNHVTAKNYLGQINITCNGVTCSLTNGTTAPSLTITSGASSSGGIIINGLNRTTFSGIVANHTFAAPTVTINGFNYSHFTITNSSGSGGGAAPKVVINSFNSSSHTIGATSPISISNSSSSHTISCPTCITSDPAPKVSINTLNRSTFINIMDTNSSVLSDLSNVAGGANDGQVLTFQASNSTWIASTPTSSGGPTVLASNTTTTSITSFKTIWTIPLTVNSGSAIEGVLIASTNTAGGAVQVGANVTSTHAQGSCTFSYASAATTGTYFSGVLSTTSTDSAWTAIVAGANQPYPIYFNCAVVTDSTATSLKINFQGEVASTVSIKAGSFYIKTP